MSTQFIANHVRNVVAAMGFDMRKSLKDRDLELEANVMDKFTDLGLSPTDLGPLQQFFQSSCLLASLCYKHNPMDVKAYVAIYTILLLGVDDLFSEGSSIRTFAHRFGTHEAQGHPFLDCLARLLRVETPKLFGPFGTNIIITATLDGINGSTLETMFPRGLPKLMPAFSSWQRTWTGYSLAYGCFIFPDAEFPESEFLGRYVQIKPSLRDVISFVNDILSFYKERILAKEVCLIANLAQEKSISDLASLKLVCDSALSLDKDIRQFLAGDGTVLGAYVGFLLGYLEWHFRVDRYRLEELGLTLA
ncbi:trichodiene synthase [Trichoderma aethiopicum]